MATGTGEDSESAPLLERDRDFEHEAVYKRFSPIQKRWIITMVSLCELLPRFMSGTFIPSIPEIARDLDSTGEVISLGVSLYLLVNALGCMLWATYSAFYGRRPVYLISLTFQCIGSLGIATSRSVASLLFFRVLQAFGASSGVSIGLSVVGDVFKLEERGTASGIFFASVYVGPVLAPVIGGFMAQYYSWRIMQLVLFISGLTILTIVSLFLPETIHPGTRGLDSLQTGKRRWVWLNPFKSLALLRSPNVTIVAMASGLTALTDYALLVPIAYTIGKRYGINNAAIIGALFIPNGFGNLTGAPFGGRFSDMVVIKMRQRRGGVWVPEDRLRITLHSISLVAPLCLLLCGVFVTYVEGTLGIVLNLTMFFINGFRVDFILSPAAAYGVDILHSRSAEVAAATMALRGLIVASCTSMILPTINAFGILNFYAITSCLGWAGLGLLWSVVAYGDRMRAYAEVGYSTVRDN
ncbi:MFS general substrate transporter [Cristinia sonorae]|uniref:MFS general substrate transporter n=1 Tax=Cristinia sonorae TaxID=1940300 RepID=A0A8K0UQ68_9AGAR|nr:MFS general substrate transporter [Cristinia sonorae]